VSSSGRPCWLSVPTSRQSWHRVGCVPGASGGTCRDSRCRTVGLGAGFIGGLACTPAARSTKPHQRGGLPDHLDPSTRTAVRSTMRSGSCRRGEHAVTIDARSHAALAERLLGSFADAPAHVLATQLPLRRLSGRHLRRRRTLSLDRHLDHRNASAAGRRCRVRRRPDRLHFTFAARLHDGANRKQRHAAVRRHQHNVTSNYTFR